MKTKLCILFILLFGITSAQEEHRQTELCIQDGDTIYLAFFNKFDMLAMKISYNPRILDYYIYEYEGRYKGSMHIYDNDTTYYNYKYFQDNKIVEVYYSDGKTESLLDQYYHTPDSTMQYHFKDGRREYIQTTRFNPDSSISSITKRNYIDGKTTQSTYHYNADAKLNAEYHTIANDTVRKLIYTYSDKENSVKTYVDGNLISEVKSIYKKGLKKKQLTYNKQGLITRIQKYRYNKYAYVIKETDINLLYNKESGEQKKHIKTYVYTYRVKPPTQ